MFRTTSYKKDSLVVTSPASVLLKTADRVCPGPSLSSPQEDECARLITTLQIKNHNGKQSFVIRLFYEDTVGTLYRLLEDSAADTKSNQHYFELRSAFPSRSYLCMEETMSEAGLVPSATLFMRLLDC